MGRPLPKAGLPWRGPKTSAAQPYIHLPHPRPPIMSTHHVHPPCPRPSTTSVSTHHVHIHPPCLHPPTTSTSSHHVHDHPPRPPTTSTCTSRPERGGCLSGLSLKGTQTLPSQRPQQTWPVSQSPSGKWHVATKVSMCSSCVERRFQSLLECEMPRAGEERTWEPTRTHFLSSPQDSSQLPHCPIPGCPYIRVFITAAPTPRLRPLSSLSVASSQWPGLSRSAVRHGRLAPCSSIMRPVGFVGALGRSPHRPSAESCSGWLQDCHPASQRLLSGLARGPLHLQPSPACRILLPLCHQPGNNSSFSRPSVIGSGSPSRPFWVSHSQLIGELNHVCKIPWSWNAA